jgi:CRISPR-associated endonuclease/helicase Cas3
MLSIRLEPQYEEEWLDDNPSPATFLPAKGQRPLRHQWLTYHAEKPLIINAYNTGTGKTKAALLRLLKRTGDKNFQLNSSEDNVLFIAPTNELLAQHARDVERFCKDNNLPYRVLTMSRASLDELQQRPGFSEGKLRRGAALHAIMETPRKADSDRSKKATIFVANPDIFYYAFYLQYNRFDRVPLFQDIFTLCNYIVIDEFHYYDPKQFANFLFFIHMSKEYGFIAGSTQRQFCLLTATPSPLVDEYLSRLSLPIDRIDPFTVPPSEAEQTRKVGALAPVHLEVYSLDELGQRDAGEVEGLIALVDKKREELVTWLREGEDGAIISSSLWRIEQIYKRLLPKVALEQMGRITGPEHQEGRRDAARKQLILATPTVDIGYNFEKGEKLRQNIDFLFFDARSSDEFIQRLGRAGRVLGKPQQEIPSRVYVVVDPEFYKALQPYDGQELSRTTLRQLAVDTLPPRNDLYAYITSGAIAEAFLPLYHLKQWEQTAEEFQIEAMFERVRGLFAPNSTITYKSLRAQIRNHLARAEHYSTLENIPADKLDLLRRVIVRREQHSDKWLEPFAARLREEQKRRKEYNERWSSPQEAYEWLLRDLRCYFVEKARFSFREYFQPPLAVFYDPRKLHTTAEVWYDDALRIARYYDARYFNTRQKWEEEVRQTVPEKAKDAIVYCVLKELRDPQAQLHIGLNLYAGDFIRTDWEETFAYQLTALCGLEVVALNDSSGLPLDIQFLFSERFIPAFVVAEKSHSANEMWQLQKRAQYFPYKLRVTFGDGEFADYLVVLGTMALQVHAEIPVAVRKRDVHNMRMADDCAIIL